MGQHVPEPAAGNSASPNASRRRTKKSPCAQSHLVKRPWTRAPLEGRDLVEIARSIPFALLKSRAVAAFLA